MIVTATITDASGHQASASASCTIDAAGLPTQAEAAAWGNTTSTRTTNATYSAAATINGVLFDGARVSVSGSGQVVFNDCKFTGDNSANALVTLTDSTPRPPAVFNRCVFSAKFPRSDTNGIAGHGYILNDCLIEHVTDGVSVHNSGLFSTAGPGWATGVELHRVIIQKLGRWTASALGVVHPSDSITHNDGIQIFGGVGTVLDRVVIDCRTPALQFGHLVLQSAAGHVYTEAEAYALADNAALISVPNQSLANGGPFAFAGDATHAPRPLAWTSNGTGLLSRGEMASPNLSCIMINSTQGYVADLDIHDCYFLGGQYAINGGGNPYPGGTVNWGSMLRCRFDHSQGDQAAGGDATHTVTLYGNWAGHATIPTTGVDANLYDTGAPVRVRF